MARVNVIERGTFSGLDYLILGLSLGHRCGYVRVPEDHPWHGVTDEMDPQLNKVRVHGGLTFCGNLKAEGWWLGFDCAHAGDARDPSLYDDEQRAIQAEYPWPTFGDETIRDTAYVRDECESLAKQIAEANR